ncbi:MAG TPA: penicillin-binding transpeptidase domain-containing protein, partial [Terriglobales bacterium]|nr:penicillin-binding transpeptidase domain-containing protein [Terriglobales bacterium]
MLRTLVAILLLVASCAAVDLNPAIAKIMRGRSGTAVMVDVPSGRVLGTYHLDVAARRLARPGSAFKPFTLLALLQSGKLKTTDRWTC